MVDRVVQLLAKPCIFNYFENYVGTVLLGLLSIYEQMYCSYIALELKYEFDLFQIQRLILLQLGGKTAKQLT